MAHINHSLVGDPLYGGRLQLPAASSEDFSNFLRNFRRQALHARRLALIHPAAKELMAWEVDAPNDFQQLLRVLKEDQSMVAPENE